MSYNPIILPPEHYGFDPNWRPAPPEHNSGCGCSGGGGGGARPSEKKESKLKIDRDTVIPILYGKRKIGGIPIPIGVVGSRFYVVYLFCEGEITSFSDLKIDGKEPPAGATSYGQTYYSTGGIDGTYSFGGGLSSAVAKYSLTYYTGSPTQAVDPGLAGAFPEWEERLACTAYAAAWFEGREFDSLPKISVVAEGLKVYDPRTSHHAYSSNPILCAVDHMTNPRYGASVDESCVDWDSVIAAADYCDEEVNGECRFEINYNVVSPSPIENVQSYILNHCNGERVYSGGVYFYHCHQARSAVAEFGDEEIFGTTLSRPPASEIFNRLRASYTTGEWVEDEYCLESAGLSAGNELLSEASFDFTGCGSLSQVHRLSIFQLNRSAADLRIVFNSYNLKGVERFDRIQISSELWGNIPLDFVVVSVTGFTVAAQEYQEAFFSEEYLADPDIPDVELPSAGDIPNAVTGLSLEEDVSQAKDTHFTSVIVAKWTASDFGWVDYYEIWLKKEEDDSFLFSTTTETAASILVSQDHKNFTVGVVVVSHWQKKSEMASGSIFVEGKNWEPVWPENAAITGAEAGDVAVLHWDAASDEDTIKYEIRRGRATDTWATSSWVATVDALNYFDRSAPSGDWRYFVKAFDSVGSETEDALHTDITVTLNPNLAFDRTQEIDLTGGSAVQVAVAPSGTDHDMVFPAVTTNTWGDRVATTLAWSASSVFDPWLLPVPTTGAITLESAVVDMGAQFSGSFTLNYTAEKIGIDTASIGAELMLSDDDVTYTSYAAASTITGTSRYLKVKLTWTCLNSTACYVVREPVTVNIVASPVIEFGTATVDATGSKSITFNMTFVAVDKVLLTPQGGTAVIALADNISVTGFDIKTFDTSGSATSATVGWKIEGV